MKEKILPRALVYDKIAADYLESSLISYGLLLNAYLIIAIRYELSGNYDRLLSTCQEAIDKFNGRTIKREIAVFMFDIRRIICQIQMGLHEDVDKVAEAHYNKMTVGSQNWFMLKMYHAISKFHSRRYSEVKDILNEVQGNREYNKLSQAIKQIWTVIEAYVEFIIAIGIIPSNHHSQFRINRFLNELTIFTKDKKGINIAILIIQVIFLLQQHKYSQIIDRTDALKQYCYRYLKKDDTFRSNCFIQMLLQMPRADFNRQRTARYAEPYLLRLQSVPLRVSEQTIEVEVIPYEDLWEMTLKLLD